VSVTWSSIKSSRCNSPKKLEKWVERISVTKRSHEVLDSCPKYKRFDSINKSIWNSLFIPPTYTNVSELSERKFEFEKQWEKTNDHINSVIQDIHKDVKEILGSKAEIAEILENSKNQECGHLVNTVHKSLKTDTNHSRSNSQISDKIERKSHSSKSSYKNELDSESVSKNLTVKGTKEQDYLTYDIFGVPHITTKVDTTEITANGIDQSCDDCKSLVHDLEHRVLDELNDQKNMYTTYTTVYNYN